MENTLYAIDALVMKGVNTSIHAYNWTTGGTKEELAALMQMGALAISVMMPFSDGIERGLTCALIRGPLETLFTHQALKYNKLQIEREKNALERNLKDLCVEHLFKPYNKLFAYAWTTGSLTVNCGYLSNIEHMNKEHDSVRHYSDMLSSLARSTGCLTICGDNLPPRKNCLKRGWEKLTEKI